MLWWEGNKGCWYRVFVLTHVIYATFMDFVTRFAHARIVAIYTVVRMNGVARTRRIPRAEL